MRHIQSSSSTKTRLLFSQLRHLTWICKKKKNVVIILESVHQFLKMLKETSAWKRPWNMMKLLGAFLPPATSNKLITPRSLDEEDKSRAERRWALFQAAEKTSTCRVWEAILSHWKPFTHWFFRTERVKYCWFQTSFNQLQEDIKYLACILTSTVPQRWKCQHHKIYACNIFLMDVLSCHLATNRRLQ